MTPFPKTIPAREHREARFAHWRSQGFSVNASRLVVGVSAATGRLYERRRLESAVAASEASAA